MNHLLNKTNFHVIECENEKRLLFYTPNSQVFPLIDEAISTYIDVCQNIISYDESKLDSTDFHEIFNFVNHQFDNSEKPTINKSIRSEIESVVLPIAGECNLKCSYCFARVNDKYHFSNMSKNEAELIIDSLFKNKKTNSLTINFFGGEPFLNFTTMQHIVDYIKKYYGDKNIFYSATTNGTILNSSILEFIKKNNIAILISLDGPEEINIHRKYRNGRNSFNKVIQNILI